MDENDELNVESSWYLALKTMDEASLSSDLSNVAIVVIPDLVPPAQVEDLSALFDEDEGEVLITFTSPGDDGFQSEEVASYQLRFTTSPNIDLTANFEKGNLIKESMLLGQSTLTPIPGGERVNLRVNPLAFGVNVTNSIAVSASDSSGNTGSASNLAVLLIPDVFPPSLDDSNLSAASDLIEETGEEVISVSFVAPGDDINIGKGNSNHEIGCKKRVLVTRYDLRYATSEEALSDLDSFLTSGVEVKEDMLTQGTSLKPVSGGRYVNLKVFIHGRPT